MQNIHDVIKKTLIMLEEVRKIYGLRIDDYHCDDILSILY